MCTFGIVGSVENVSVFSVPAQRPLAVDSDGIALLFGTVDGRVGGGLLSCGFIFHCF